MKYAVILLIIFIAIVTWQNKHYTRRSDEQYRQAIADLPDRPAQAYEKIKVTFKYSNLLSFGKVAKAQRDFFTALRDRIISRIQSEDDLKLNWIGAASEALGVLREAGESPDCPAAIKAALPDHQKAVFAALVQNQEHIVQTTGLASWDALVKTMADLEGKGILTDAEIPGASEWIAELRKVDREGILWRETMRTARDELNAGLVALGLPYSTESTGPLIVKINKKTTDQALFDADRAFMRGIGACGRFSKTFGNKGVKDSLPPEMEAVWAKLTFNLGSIRLAHLIDNSTANLSRAVSYYMAQLYIVPGSDSIPGDAQIYSSFINVVADQLRQGSESFDRLSGSLDDAAALSALAQWTLVGYGKVLARENVSSVALSRFQAMRSSVGGSASGSAVLADLDNSDYPFVIAR